MTLTASDENGTVEVKKDGVVLVRYRVATDASKPHISTVALPPSAGEPAGKNLVLAAPHDHQWHLSLFFCQKRRRLSDSLSIGRVQLLDIDAVEVAKRAM